MVAIMMVLELPPSESLRSHVSTESRYGMKTWKEKKILHTRYCSEAMQTSALQRFVLSKGNIEKAVKVFRQCLAVLKITFEGVFLIN